MLQVNEIFGPTVQGEGKSAGRPCAFLRLANCNLHCIWCDTPHTWNWTGTNFAHPDKYERSKEVHKMDETSVIDTLIGIEMSSALEGKPISTLIVSGGEPFLQQKALIPLFQKLKERGWWIEVETNGTLAPLSGFCEQVNQINCSPKLANSLDSLRLRRRNEALKALSREPKVNFKFVIEQEDDLEEVLELCSLYRFKEVRLMPECQTKDELQKKESWLEPICKDNGFIYCTRLSILMSGTKRGV